MQGTAVKDESALVAEEARLARAAAAGDGSAFAVLYERYGQRAFNLAYRIAGSEADAADAVRQAFLEAMRRAPLLGEHELTFGPQLFAATRHACHEPMGGRQRPRPGAAIAESTAPLEQGESEGEIREANMRLPEHQREALALRELEELSYEEIATIMETNAGSVAQLISRARINLHDELRGNVLASVAAPSSECERALPLIAARDDGQLDLASDDGTWLEAHLAGCGRCRLGVEVMREAGEAYGSWAPIAPPPGLLKEAMAKSSIAVGLAVPGPGESFANEPSNGSARSGASAAPGSARQRRRASIAAGLAALLLLAGVAAAVVGGDDPPATPVDAAAGSAGGASAASPESGAKANKAGKRKRANRKSDGRARTVAAETGPGETAAEETASAPTSVPTPTTGGDGASTETASGPDRPSGEAAVQPTRATSAPRPAPRPKPAATPTAVPQPAPPPPVEEPPPAHDFPGNSDGHAEPPGKPADRPPK